MVRYYALHRSVREEIRSVIAKWKAEVLSPYCLSECTQSCCQFGDSFRIDITEDELRVMLGNPDGFDCTKEEFRNDGLSRRWHWEVFSYQKSNCPQYCKDSKTCLAYDDPNRPADCQEFPVNLINSRDNAVIALKKKCHAISNAISGENNIDTTLLDDLLERYGLGHEHF